MSTPALLDRPDLAERIRARDPEVLQVVVETYLPQILRAARGVGLKPQEAEEVAQNTFTTFVESAERFEGRSHVRTWIFGILYRKISETRRKLGKDRQMDDIDEVFESRFDENGTWSQPSRAADVALEAKQTRQEIADCLEAAPSKQRMAFVLREVEGLSSEEIAPTIPPAPRPPTTSPNSSPISSIGSRSPRIKTAEFESRTAILCSSAFGRRTSLRSRPPERLRHR
jgi:RNA polymerase sigma-70 factor (ECF subfamily)